MGTRDSHEAERRIEMQSLKPALLTVICIVASGCASHYLTPAGGVSLAELAVDTGSRPSLPGNEESGNLLLASADPASPFPANIAVVRVQDSGYATKTSHGYGHGRYSIVTTRDIETDADFAKVANLPLVHGVAPVGRLLVPVNANTIKDLRAAAALLRADLLLIYSVEPACHSIATCMTSRRRSPARTGSPDRSLACAPAETRTARKVSSPTTTS
jgi:hypothetical protein